MKITLADISVACPLMVTVPAQLPIDSYPNVRSWFERFQGLDAWKKVSS